MDWVVWKYDRWGRKSERYRDYMPIQSEYYKTTIHKSESSGAHGMSISNSWEEEGVRSTEKNLHSDALLNMFALMTFIITGTRWAYESAAGYGWYSSIFSSLILLWVAAVFLDRGVFS